MMAARKPLVTRVRALYAHALADAQTPRRRSCCASGRRRGLVQRRRGSWLRGAVRHTSGDGRWCGAALVRVAFCRLLHVTASILPNATSAAF
jgi:hypothetical protein